MARVLINLPKAIRRGEPFEVRLLIAHPMESGQRRDPVGAIIPRDIIHHFTCTLNGALVIEAELFPAISANPFLSFTARAEESGELVCTWVDDHGAEGREVVGVTVA
ncbi:MAG TPA: thiosulfate oxidation carrier complex protein SoxZ [Acetobacteraceae bacterium]